jgi:drug/metabolite transporter (DMT)-like permease
LALGGTIISFSAVFVQLTHIAPGISAFYRVAFGAFFLLLWMLYKRPRLFTGGRHLALLLLAGLFFAADLYAWHHSILYIGPGLATIVTNFQVFILAAMGVLFFREPVTARMLVSAPLAVFGLALALGIQWHQLPQTDRLGIYWALTAAAAYAGFTIMLRAAQRLPTTVPAWVNLFSVTAVTALLLGALGLAQERSFAIGDGQTLLALLGLGLLCQVVGWIVITGALNRVQPSVVGLALLLQPTLAFMWDIFFFGRSVTIVNLLGVALAIGGIYLGSAPSRRRA